MSGHLTDDGAYRIDGVERMEPFLMTVVSDTDLWMFVSSNGALTAGRVDADRALFPYLTDDRLQRSVGRAGPVTVIARDGQSGRELWRPFGAEMTPGCTRAVEKSVQGDRLVFEERHASWGLAFRATWSPSDSFGWVRDVELIETAGHGADVEVLDGLLDVMPAGIDAHTEQIRSNLADAYKRSEVGPWGRLAVYSIEALIIDRAEPGESLTATTVWSHGLDGATVDLDERAVRAMVEMDPPPVNGLVTGRPGAYLLRAPVRLEPGGRAGWSIVADTGATQGDVVRLAGAIADSATPARIRDDVVAGSRRLRELLAGADALQSTADPIADAHHLSNVLFNCMRGGVFPFGHLVPREDFAAFLRSANARVAARNARWLDALGEWIDEGDLRVSAQSVGDDDLVRLVLEYLPLTFSRRHGDPSRPWNRFSIHVRDERGEPVLGYEGNWRDIFQNWEALLVSFPAYYANVVAKFVNASTLDGYNPYRISRSGVDWEVPDPDDPWSNIGYWGDHQIVYLLRLLEAWDAHEPGALVSWMQRPVFTYSDVPYTIADHADTVADPRDTITFDEERALAIERREQMTGSDGRLVVDAEGNGVRVGLAEKLLVAALAKLSNLVPGGGIWMNTQRPEWNDANNALAGPGLSMVTLYQLRRYLGFLRDRFSELGADLDTVELTPSVAAWLGDIDRVLAATTPDDAVADDRLRRRFVDDVGTAAERHRHRLGAGASQPSLPVAIETVLSWCEHALAHVDASASTGRRPDDLYHSYNLVRFPDAETATVGHLGPMLEGQVAVLSSGLLSAQGSLDVIDALFASPLFRQGVRSFILYPATELPSFVERNVIPPDRRFVDEVVEAAMLADPDGTLRFRPELVNEAALIDALDRAGVSADARANAIDAYEDVFHQSSFTGRSSSMYGYEGLGSVYWHMVAKLLLAVQELHQGAEGDERDRLAEAYRRIRDGLGFRATPEGFGAIPTDCYSHTPAHAGAQQPGMTGQVKEEVLTRFGELGLCVGDGRISVRPGILPLGEIADGDVTVAEFTYCAVPMTLRWGDADSVTVTRADSVEPHDGASLPATTSAEIFARSGDVVRIDWVCRR